MKLDRMRLKWRIVIFLLGFCALLLTLLWMFQTVLLTETYKLIRTWELKQSITEVENEINNPKLAEILLRLQSEKEIFVTPAKDFVPPQRPENESPGRRGNMLSITETKEFTLKNGQTMSLTFYAMIVPVSATITTLRVQLYVITGVMLALSLTLAVIIAKRVSKPIEDINQSARTLAAGDYSTRFNGSGFHEIVELSNTLNTAAIELGKVERLRRELLANVSHDLRTPLALIYSYAEMMTDFPGEITPEQTRVIAEETRRLTSLVNDALDISKLESDMEQLDAKSFNLTCSIGDTVGRVRELLKNDGFDITFIHDGEVFVCADEVKIGRAFYNLLINAVNYSGGSRVIFVAQTVLENRVRISVRDEGEGIAQEDIEFIWDRYYKSVKRHKRAITGTGLGLPIVKKIIELHGGCYGAATELGKGSTFWFEIDISKSCYLDGRM